MKLIAITILFFLANFSFSQTKIITSKQTFSKNNFQIQYPYNWSLDTSKVMGSEFFLFSPFEGESDKFRENINGIIQDWGGENIDLQKYKEITDKQINQTLNGVKVLQSSIVKKDSNAYFQILYTMIQGKLKLKITSICYINDGKAYLVTFSSEVAKYLKYKKVADEILNSFLIVK